MIIIFNDSPKRHKKALKCHAKAMLRVCQSYAHDTKVALLSVLKLCFLMVKDMLKYFKSMLEQKLDDTWGYR